VRCCMANASRGVAAGSLFGAPTRYSPSSEGSSCKCTTTKVQYHTHYTLIHHTHSTLYSPYPLYYHEGTVPYSLYTILTIPTILPRRYSTILTLHYPTILTILPRRYSTILTLHHTHSTPYPLYPLYYHEGRRGCGKVDSWAGCGQDALVRDEYERRKVQP
jgi:hypothetical protein